MKKLIIDMFVKFFERRIGWRIRNRHNKTYCLNVYDINCVSIGVGTYGPIDIEMSRNDVFLKIGNYCSIANGTKFILSSEHDMKHISMYPFKTMMGFNGNDATAKGDIVLEDDVWIGCNAVILSGVHIGQGAVVAAGAVVTKDIPAYAVVAGNPAHIIKYRFDKEYIDELLKIDFSKIDKNIVKDNEKLFFDEVGDYKKLRILPQKDNRNV